MVACPSLPLPSEGRAPETLERDYFACLNLLLARGHIPGQRLDGDVMGVLLYLLKQGPGHCEFIARHAWKSPVVIGGLAKRFSWSERKARYVVSRLKRLHVDGVPLLRMRVVAPLDSPVPWAPDRARRGPNLWGYELAATELRALLERAEQRERLERHQAAQERARRRALAAVSAPLPKRRPEPCAVREDDPRVLQVDRAWEALKMPDGTSGRGRSLERDGRRTVAARLAAGWSLEELLCVVAGAGVDEELRASKKRLPWAYAFGSVGGLMQRYAAAGRVVFAKAAPPAVSAVTWVQNPAPTLVDRSGVMNHGSLKTTTAQGARAPAAQRRVPPAPEGPAPSAPRSHVALPPHAPAMRAPSASAPKTPRAPPGKHGGREEQGAHHARVSSAAGVLAFLDRGGTPLPRPRSSWSERMRLVCPGCGLRTLGDDGKCGACGARKDPAAE